MKIKQYIQLLKKADVVNPDITPFTESSSPSLTPNSSPLNLEPPQPAYRLETDGNTLAEPEIDLNTPATKATPKWYQKIRIPNFHAPEPPANWYGYFRPGYLTRQAARLPVGTANYALKTSVNALTSKINLGHNFAGSAAFAPVPQLFTNGWDSYTAGTPESVEADKEHPETGDVFSNVWRRNALRNSMYRLNNGQDPNYEQQYLRAVIGDTPNVGFNLVSFANPVVPVQMGAEIVNLPISIAFNKAPLRGFEVDNSKYHAWKTEEDYNRLAKSLEHTIDPDRWRNFEKVHQTPNWVADTGGSWIDAALSVAPLQISWKDPNSNWPTFSLFDYETQASQLAELFGQKPQFYVNERGHKVLDYQKLFQPLLNSRSFSDLQGTATYPAHVLEQLARKAHENGYTLPEINLAILNSKDNTNKAANALMLMAQNPATLHQFTFWAHDPNQQADPGEYDWAPTLQGSILPFGRPRPWQTDLMDHDFYWYKKFNPEKAEQHKYWLQDKASRETLLNMFPYMANRYPDGYFSDEEYDYINNSQAIKDYWTEESSNILNNLCNASPEIKTAWNNTVSTVQFQQELASQLIPETEDISSTNTRYLNAFSDWAAPYLEKDAPFEEWWGPVSNMLGKKYENNPQFQIWKQHMETTKPSFVTWIEQLENQLTTTPEKTLQELQDSMVLTSIDMQLVPTETQNWINSQLANSSLDPTYKTFLKSDFTRKVQLRTIANMDYRLRYAYLQHRPELAIEYANTYYEPGEMRDTVLNLLAPTGYTNFIHRLEELEQATPVPEMSQEEQNFLFNINHNMQRVAQVENEVANAAFRKLDPNLQGQWAAALSQLPPEEQVLQQRRFAISEFPKERVPQLDPELEQWLLACQNENIPVSPEWKQYIQTHIIPRIQANLALSLPGLEQGSYARYVYLRANPQAAIDYIRTYYVDSPYKRALLKVLVPEYVATMPSIDTPAQAVQANRDQATSMREASEFSRQKQQQQFMANPGTPGMSTTLSPFRVRRPLFGPY